MSLNQIFINELKHEGAATRKMLERVPMDKADWKPHEKSTTLQSLAQHVAQIPVWINRVLEKDDFDFAGGFGAPKPAQNTEELLAIHDKHIADAVKALESATDEQIMQNWSMRRGEHVMATMPRLSALRSMAMNHLVHHRGQLSVYLRLLDVPVPGMYGPSADEKRG